jgi:hypothetical protein
MLRHYVFIRYQPGTDDAHIAEFTRRMEALRTTVPGIEHLQVGRDILKDARSWDLMLVMDFLSVEALRQYQQHPAHQAVMAFNHGRVAEVGSIDFMA